MTTTNNNEKRIAKYSRTQAKAIITLRSQGHLTAARKVEDDAIRTVELMRAGEL